MTDEKSYIAPEIEMWAVKVEMGFLNSTQANSLEDPVEKDAIEW